TRPHSFINPPAEEEGIGLVEVLDRVTMQLFIRGNCTMIAAPVQCDVDGIPKGSHSVRVPPMVVRRKLCPSPPPPSAFSMLVGPATRMRRPGFRRLTRSRPNYSVYQTSP